MLTAVYKQQELSARLEVVNREWAVCSGEETVIGAYDGKPLYRKKIQTISPSVAGDTQVIAEYPDGVSPGNVVSLTGFLFQSDVLLQPINLYAVDNYIFTVPFAAGISMYVTAPFRNKKVVLTLEYTKTTDPEGTIQAILTNYVHSYDTEDGWHVRKYSDGYVEMSKYWTKANPAWTSPSNGPAYSPLCGDTEGVYPVPLVELYSFYGTASMMGGGFGLHLMSGYNESTALTRLPGPFVVTYNAYSGGYVACTAVTGRWK